MPSERETTDAIDYAEVLALHAEAARGAGLDGCRVKPWLLEGAAAEIERLRAALERLRDCDWTITPLDRMDAVRDIARAALEGRDDRPHP